MRHHVDAGVVRHTQAAWRRVAGDERAAAAPPEGGADEPWPARAVDWFDGVERGEDLTPDAGLRRRDANQRDELTAVIWTDVGDSPSPSAYTYVVAGFRRTSVCVRNLHRASAVRGAESATPSARLSSPQRVTCGAPDG